MQLLPGAPAPAFRLCVRSAVWLLGTSKSYLYDKSAHTNLSRVQEWEAGRMRGVSIVPCNICRRGGGCQLADGEFRVVDLLQADGICACCDGTALRLGGARCSAKLQRLLRDDRGGLLQQAHDDYHTSHHGYLERGGRRLTQARRLRAVATLLERGLCRCGQMAGLGGVGWAGCARGSLPAARGRCGWAGKWVGGCVCEELCCSKQLPFACRCRHCREAVRKVLNSQVGADTFAKGRRHSAGLGAQPPGS